MDVVTFGQRAREIGDSRVPSSSTRAIARGSPRRAREGLRPRAARGRGRRAPQRSGQAPRSRPRCNALLVAPWPPSEIVVISDFQHGTINDAACIAFRPTSGLRLVQSGNPVQESPPLVGSPADGRTTEQRVGFEGPRTRPSSSRRARPGGTAAEDPGAAELSSGGRAAPAGGRARPARRRDRPMTFVFPGVPTPAAHPCASPDDRGAGPHAGRCGAPGRCHLDAAMPRCTLSAAWIPVRRDGRRAAGLGGRWSLNDLMVVGVGAAFRRVAACRGACVPHGGASPTPNWTSSKSGHRHRN